MEHLEPESRERDVTDLKDDSLMFPIPSKKSEITKSQHLGTNFASSTPEKTTELSRVERPKDIAGLPENYRALAELFDRMVCSLRLLRLRKKSPTFQRISSQVEVLTGRKFLYGHLAQIMYIIPEAVHIDKILVHDEKTCCMKSDVKVTLHLDAMEDHHEHSIFMHLSNVFQAKLIDLFGKHPEDCNIPEAILPEPFSGSSITAKPYSLPVNLSSPLDTEILESSHLSPSLSSHFSQKAVVPKEKKTQLLVSSIPCSFVDDGPIQATESEMAPPRSCPKSPIVTDSVQQTQLLLAGSSKTCENTPLKLTSENNNLLLETPAQSTPRRSLSATEDKHKKVISQSALASNLTVKRSLMDDLDWSETVDSIFPQMDIKGTSASGSVTTSAIHLSEVEKSSCTSGKDKRGLPVHQQIYVGLPNLVHLIHNIFQSLGRDSVTKEELFHKILMADCDVDENSDIEGQIDLLEKLVPEWICKKLAPTGGFLYSLKSGPDLNSVCERLIST
nr:CDT1-like protein A, chloroplastic isoform X1 [Ipomoea batatas]